MHKLMEYICDELDELERKADKEGKLSMTEIEYADVLAHLKKDILTSDAMMEDSKYSEYDGWYRMPDGRRVYRDGESMRGSSYAPRRRDSRGRYMSADGYHDTIDDISDKLETLLDEAKDEKSRMEIRKFMGKLEQM